MARFFNYQTQRFEDEPLYPPEPPPEREYFGGSGLERRMRDIVALTRAPMEPEWAYPSVVKSVPPPVEAWDVPRAPSFTPGRYPGTTGEGLPWPSTAPVPLIPPEEAPGLTPFQQYAERLRASVRPEAIGPQLRAPTPEEEMRRAAYGLPVLGSLLRRLDIGPEQERQIRANLPQTPEPVSGLAPHERIGRGIEVLSTLDPEMQERLRRGEMGLPEIGAFAGTSAAQAAQFAPFPGPGVAAGMARKVGPGARTVAAGRKGKGIAELPPEWETRVAEGARTLRSRIGAAGDRLDYPGGETAARERVTALKRALQVPISEVRRSEILDQELPYLQAFLSQPPPYQYPVPLPGTARRGMPTIQQSALERQRATQTDWKLRARAAEAARAADDARGGAGVAERAEQAGFDVEGKPISVPFKSEVRPELLPQTIEGVQGRLPLGEDFYKAPGLSLQEEELLAQAVKRGDRKTIQRLTRRGQGQLMEERLPYSANGAYELSPDAITTNPLHQPRKGLDEANVQRIVENYDPNRFLPVEVREINPGVFELIHGHHRLEAARRLALKRIPVRVLNVSSEDAIRLAEEANLAGQPLKPTEIARLLDKRLRQAQTPVEIVRAFPGAGIRAGQVEDYARIVNLPRIVLEAVDDPVLSRQFTVQHAMRLAKAQQKYSMPADEVQAFFNEVIMKQEMTPAQMERVLDNFAPVLRKESESQGALFGGSDFQGTYTGIMATIRGAVGDIKSLESLERRMKGIVSFIEAGKEVPEELAAARAPLERQIAGIRQRIVQAQKAVTGEIHAERGATKPAPEAPAVQAGRKAAKGRAATKLTEKLNAVTATKEETIASWETSRRGKQQKLLDQAGAKPAERGYVLPDNSGLTFSSGEWVPVQGKWVMGFEPPNERGLIRIVNESEYDLADQLKRQGIAFSEKELPEIAGMGGNARVVSYVSPEIGELDVLAIPHRFDIDQFSTDYYYFEHRLERNWEEEFDALVTVGRQKGKTYELPIPEAPLPQQAGAGAAAKQPRIIVPDDPSEYGVQVVNARIRQPNGEVVRGTPISPDDPMIPDTIYHVTTNASAVRKSGILRGAGEGGLGGAKGDQLVSFTTEAELAAQIAEDLKLASRLAKMVGELPPVHWDTTLKEWVGAGEREKALQPVADYLEQLAAKEGWKFDAPSKVRLGTASVTDILRSYFPYRESAIKVRNPVLFTDDEALRRINPDNIAVVDVPKGNLKTGAMITDFDLSETIRQRAQYGHPIALSEVRLYGDVPLTNSRFMSTSEAARGAPARPGVEPPVAAGAGVRTAAQVWDKWPIDARAALIRQIDSPILEDVPFQTQWADLSSEAQTLLTPPLEGVIRDVAAIDARTAADATARAVPISERLAPTGGGARKLTQQELRDALLGEGAGGAGQVPPLGTRPPSGRPPGEIPPSSGIPGTPPPLGSPLDRTIQMFKAADKQPTAGQNLRALYASLPEHSRAFQEAFTDRFAGINAMKKGLTRKVSPLEDPEVQVARLGGIGDTQAQRAEDIAKSVKGALGEPWTEVEYHLDSYLHLKQAIDIAAVKGVARKIPGGIKGLGEAQQGLDELQTLLGVERWERLERAAQTAVAEGQETLRRLVAEGLIEQELADTLLRLYPHYNKQNILREIEQIISGVGTKRISVTNANLRRLTEEGTERGRASAYASIIGSAADAEALIFRNRAAKAVGRMAIELGIGKRVAAVRKVAEVEGEAVFRRPPGEIRGTLSYMEDGQRVVVEVPDWLEKEAKLIYETGDDVLLRSASIINSLPRSAFVTYNPTWPAANLSIDYFTALMTQGVTPLEEFRGLLGAIRDLSGNDPVLAQMRRSGGGQAGWFARGPQDIAKIVKESGNLAITETSQFRRMLTNPVELFKATVGAPFRGIRAIGQAFELATRRAAFVTSLKRTGITDVARATEEQLAQAAVDARRVSIDFQRAGNAARSINKLSVFFNAGVQGTLLPFRALRESPRARWALGIALGANASLYFWNRQFPEYKDVPVDVRRGSGILMLPSYEFDQRGNRKPNYISFIPKIREWGLFFGTQTYIMEKLDGMENESFGRFLAIQMAQSTPIEGISAIVPTVPGQIALEESLNQNFYRDRPIVSPELAGLPLEEQYDPYTSETLRRLGKATGMSPLRLQHVFYGLTGGAGRVATSVTDALLQTLNPTKKDFRIAQIAEDFEAIAAPTVPPEEVALRRTEFLNSLSVADREAVLDLARQPEERVPIVGSIASRFYAPRGGEQYRLGQERAEQITGKSAEKTQEASRALNKVFDVLDERQEAQDKTLEENWTGKNAKAWREVHKENSVMYQGALLGLGVIFPSAAQLGDRAIWQQYQTAIYTLAGTIQDTRTKGQLLVAAYRAIPLEEIDPLTKDFDTFFQRREEFKASLSIEDRKLFERVLESTMTPTEKKYARDMETLRAYWTLGDRIAENLGPVTQQVVTAVKRGQVNKDALQQNYAYAVYKHLLERERELFRRRDQKTDDALVKWYEYTPVRKPNTMLGTPKQAPGTTRTSQGLEISSIRTERVGGTVPIGVR